VLDAVGMDKAKYPTLDDLAMRQVGDGGRAGGRDGGRGGLGEGKKGAHTYRKHALQPVDYRKTAGGKARPDMLMLSSLPPLFPISIPSHPHPYPTPHLV